MRGRDPDRGHRLRTLRLQAGRTQKALARAVGVTERALQEWEAGGPIADPNILALSHELGIAPDVLMDGGGTDEPVDQVGLLERRIRRHEASIAQLSAIADQVRALEQQQAELVAAVRELLNR